MDYCKKNYVKEIATHLYHLGNLRSNEVIFNHFPAQKCRLIVRYIDSHEFYFEMYIRNRNSCGYGKFRNSMTVRLPITEEVNRNIANFFSDIPGVNPSYAMDGAANRLMCIVAERHFRYQKRFPFQC